MTRSGFAKRRSTMVTAILVGLLYLKKMKNKWGCRGIIIPNRMKIRINTAYIKPPARLHLGVNPNSRPNHAETSMAQWYDFPEIKWWVPMISRGFQWSTAHTILGFQVSSVPGPASPNRSWVTWIDWIGSLTFSHGFLLSANMRAFYLRSCWRGANKAMSLEVYPIVIDLEAWVGGHHPTIQRITRVTWPPVLHENQENHLEKHEKLLSCTACWILTWTKEITVSLVSHPSTTHEITDYAPCLQLFHFFMSATPDWWVDWYFFRFSRYDVGQVIKYLSSTIINSTWDQDVLH